MAKGFQGKRHCLAVLLFYFFFFFPAMEDTSLDTFSHHPTTLPKSNTPIKEVWRSLEGSTRHSLSHPPHPLQPRAVASWAQDNNELLKRLEGIGAREGEAETGKCDSVPCIKIGWAVPRESHSYICRQNGSHWSRSNNNLEVINHLSNGKSHLWYGCVRKLLCNIRISGSQGVCKMRVLCVSLVVWLQIPPARCTGQGPDWSVVYTCAISADRDSVVVIHSTAGFGPSWCCSWWGLSFEVWISSFSIGVNTNAINYWKLQSEVYMVDVSRCCVAEFATL